MGRSFPSGRPEFPKVIILYIYIFVYILTLISSFIIKFVLQWVEESGCGSLVQATYRSLFGPIFGGSKSAQKVATSPLGCFSQQLRVTCEALPFLCFHPKKNLEGGDQNLSKSALIMIEEVDSSSFETMIPGWPLVPGLWVCGPISPVDPRTTVVLVLLHAFVSKTRSKIYRNHATSSAFVLGDILDMARSD